MREVDLSNLKDYVGKTLYLLTNNLLFEVTLWLSMGPTYFIRHTGPAHLDKKDLGFVQNGEISIKGAKLYTK